MEFTFAEPLEKHFVRDEYTRYFSLSIGFLCHILRQRCHRASESFLTAGQPCIPLSQSIWPHLLVVPGSLAAELRLAGQVEKSRPTRLSHAPEPSDQGFVTGVIMVIYLAQFGISG